MNPAAPFASNTEEHAQGLYRQMGIYAPFVWLALRMIRLGQRAGFISPEFLMPPRVDISPELFFRNRQLRRAEASCLRRAARCLLQGGTIKPERYTPHAYAHLPYIARMDKTITPAQFNERYIRDNIISRVQVYGLDAAHEITGFIQSVIEKLSRLFSNLESSLGLASLSCAAPADPAPP
ncbi:MAG: hypothetical protein ACSHXY_01170 [Alphaproteobacteria bacterium]